MRNETIRDAIGHTVQHLAENTADAHGTDGCAVAEVDGLKALAWGERGVSVTSDMPKSMGGEDSAPSPGWLFRAAIASCEAMMIAMTAARGEVELSNIRVTVDSESDDRGMLGMSDTVPPGPLSMKIRVEVSSTTETEDRILEIVEWAARHSPLSDAVERAVPTTLDIDIASLASPT